MIYDTSVLVALLDPNDAHADEARALYDQHGPGTIQQTTLRELARFVYSRTRRHGPKATARQTEAVAIDRLTRVLGFRIAPVQDMATALDLYHANPDLSLVDACGIADAHAMHELITFDENQRDALRERLGVA